MYKDYIKEREGLELIYTDKGFCSYEKNGECLFVSDIYIKPEYRKENVAKDMINQIVEKHSDCKYLMGAYSTKAKNWKESMRFIIKMGLKYYKEDTNKNMVYLIKEIM